MSDLNLNITAKPASGSGGGTNPSPATDSQRTDTTQQRPSSSGGYVNSSDQYISEFRRQAQANGIMLAPGSAQTSQLWRQFTEQQKDTVRQQVASKFDARRADIAEKYNKDREYQLNSFEEQRQQLLEKGKGRNSKEWKQLQKEEDEEFRLIDKREKAENNAVDKDEKDELATALRELTAVLKDSKEDATRKDESGENSYLGRLRAERRQILEQRENAATEKEAVAAGKRLADVDDRIKRASSPSDIDYLRRSQYITGGIQQTFDSIQNVSPGQAINGLGSVGVGLAGKTGVGAAKALGWIGLAAGAAQGIWDAAQGSAERYNAMGNLAAMRGTYYGMRGDSASAGVRDQIENGSYMGLKVADFGMSYTDFASRASQMTRARGTSDEWFKETMRQIGLEKELALDSGSLTKGSQYDRYGINVTDALSQMVTVLEKIEGSGVSEKDFTRVQEKYDIQQQIMGSYMNRSDRPDYNAANRQLFAMSAVKDITQDARIGTDYQQFQNAIQNPMNDRMKAMLYSTVQEMMPEMVGTDGKKYTALDAGRMDLIDRAIRNPENEGKIVQAMIQKISEMYGGIDTQMGYFAFKNLFPNIAPDRLDAYVKQMSDPNSDVAKILRESTDVSLGNSASTVSLLSKANSEAWTQSSSQYIDDLTKDVAGIKNGINNLIDKLDNWIKGRGYLWGPSPNGTSGNN